MTPESLRAIAGMILSLIFSYVPKVNEWFAAKDPTIKRLLMAGLLLLVAGLLLLVAAGALGLSCAQVITSVECS